MTRELFPPCSSNSDLSEDSMTSPLAVTDDTADTFLQHLVPISPPSSFDNQVENTESEPIGNSRRSLNSFQNSAVDPDNIPPRSSIVLQMKKEADETEKAKGSLETLEQATAVQSHSNSNMESGEDKVVVPVKVPSLPQAGYSSLVVDSERPSEEEQAGGGSDSLAGSSPMVLPAGGGGAGGDNPSVAAASPLSPVSVNLLGVEDVNLVEEDVEILARRCGCPDQFFCPISTELMRDPVLIETGQTYSRASIQAWVDSCGSRGAGGNTRQCRCPVTQAVLKRPVAMFTNHALRNSIEEWARGACPAILGPDGHIRNFNPHTPTAGTPLGGGCYYEPEREERGGGRGGEARRGTRGAMGVSAASIAAGRRSIGYHHASNANRRYPPAPNSGIESSSEPGTPATGAVVPWHGRLLQATHRWRSRAQEMTVVRSCTLQAAMMQILFFILGMFDTGWKFEKGSRNPLLGPPIEELQQMGAVYGPAVVDDDEWWRIFTSPLLHSGLFHMVANISGMLVLGFQLEHHHSAFKIVPIFLITGIAGSLASILTVPDQVCCGASSLFFGLLGAFEADVLLSRCTADLLTRKQMLTVCLLTMLNLMVGLMPNVDMFGNLTALVTGILASILMLGPSQSDPGQYCRFWPELQLLAGIVLVVLLTGTAVIIKWEVHGDSWCKVCDKISCMENSIWQCQFDYAY